MFYIWNEQFVRRICNQHDEIFSNLPAAVKVFESADGAPIRTIDFVRAARLPSGLKTNRYGFRFAPQRSSNAIRTTFVGSSEKVGNHGFPFSYPDYFGIWPEK